MTTHIHPHIWEQLTPINCICTPELYPCEGCAATEIQLQERRIAERRRNNAFPYRKLIEDALNSNDIYRHELSLVGLDSMLNILAYDCVSYDIGHTGIGIVLTALLERAKL